jgi:excisionase family DNA binding protein
MPAPNLPLIAAARRGQARTRTGLPLNTHKTAAAPRRAGRKSKTAGGYAARHRKPATAKNAAREQGGIELDRQNAGLETVMTLHEVAQFLRCHESTVYRLTKRGQIPAFRLGSEWRFLRSRIEQWITNCHQSAVSPS